MIKNPMTLIVKLCLIMLLSLSSISVVKALSMTEPRLSGTTLDNSLSSCVAHFVIPDVVIPASSPQGGGSVSVSAPAWTIQVSCFTQTGNNLGLASTIGPTCGDVNEDGVVNIADSILVRRWLLGLSIPSNVCLP